jgi:hypothetical protein
MTKIKTAFTYICTVVETPVGILEFFANYYFLGDGGWGGCEGYPIFFFY